MIQTLCLADGRRRHNQETPAMMMEMGMTFGLKPGRRIRIPSGPILVQASDNTNAENAGTPMIYRLRHKKGVFQFMRDDGKQRQGGFVLFAPAGLKPGDWVTIQWVDKTCACASLATVDEILDATAMPGSSWTV